MSKKQSRAAFLREQQTNAAAWFYAQPGFHAPGNVPAYVPASKVFTSRGAVLITEPDHNPNACIEGEEISRVEVDVPPGTPCDICGEPIQ